MKTEHIPLDRLIATGRAARKLGLSNQGLSARLRAGKIRAVKIDGRAYFDAREIERIAALERSAAQ